MERKRKASAARKLSSLMAIRFDNDLLELIRDRAREEERPISWLVRRFVRQGLQAQQREVVE